MGGGVQEQKSQQSLFGVESALAFIVALIALAFTWWPGFINSPLGALDRQMIDQAFRIRSAFVSNQTDPALFIYVDEAALGLDTDRMLSGDIGTGTTPRDVIAKLLDYARRPGPQPAKSVILDLDISWRDAMKPVAGSASLDSAAPDLSAPVELSVGEQALFDALKRWSGDLAAPPLLIARQAFPDGRQAAEGERPLILPASPYDEIVASAPNIFYVDVNVYRNSDRRASEFREGVCVQSDRGEAAIFLPSAILMAARQSSKRTAQNEAFDKWLRDRQADCKVETAFEGVGEGDRRVILYQLDNEAFSQTSTLVAPRWLDESGCETKTPIFSALAASKITGSPDEFEPNYLCSRMVIIGADNPVSRDYFETPFGERPGSVVAINGARGVVGSSSLIPTQTDLLIGRGLQTVIVLSLTGLLLLVFNYTSRIERRWERWFKPFWETLDARPIVSVLLSPLWLIDMIVSPAFVLGVMPFFATFIGYFATAAILHFQYLGAVTAPIAVVAFFKLYRELRHDFAD